MIKKILGYIHIESFGLLEMLFAFFMILTGYKYGSLRFDLLTLLLMDVLALKRGKGIRLYRPLFYIAVYVILHELFLLLFVKDIPPTHINFVLGLAIHLFSIFIIAPALEYEKLKSALFLVSAISMAGIIYHFLIIQTGGSVTPIKLPFFPEMAETSRLYEEGLRPKGFYWEPAAFITFILVPLFIALRERYTIWAIMIVFTMFLSSSTTGIALSTTMVGIYILTQKVSIKFKLLTAVVMVAMLAILFMGNLFEPGMTKIRETEVETTARLINGPELVEHMPKEHLVFGFPDSHVWDYYMKNPEIKRANLILSEDHDYIFVATFWHVLAKDGIVGLVLLLYLYLIIMIRERELLPYLGALFIALFTSGIFFSSAFTYEFSFILAVIYHIYQSEEDEFENQGIGYQYGSV